MGAPLGRLRGRRSRRGARRLRGARLAREASAHHRSLNGELLRRVELSFELESAFNSKRDAQWIQEALDSGPEKPLSRKDFDAAVKSGLAKAASPQKAV